ncbi:gluconeogenesis factor YvcK family protein [Heliophilum fasciatum]|uniref:Putative gluconeogenesis factor n=1 Tax=Heliophilum fasciatum TaxID=35700 RepID=A0A4R2RDI8_9FIRM|nr:gluconeogenesis factor YvcK family protein [Heliophilum fasciatum]MCW2279048.1 putative cofD-like protein [Heliophilum fasciatum]TCP61512.1 putative cofD-like protein [Heliophilum fasciatum]
MKWLMWFYPGLKVKRWLFVSFIGFLLLGISMSLLFDGEFFGYLENKLRHMSYGLPGSTLAVFALSVFLIGLVLHVFGFNALMSSIFEALTPEMEARFVEVLYRRRSRERGPKIVVIGGGTGLSVLLRGLKEYTSNVTAIVTVADDGGSSGRLRDDLGIVAPGDVRNCMIALADTEAEMEQVLNYRFDQGHGLTGHNLGNLLLAGAARSAGAFDKAVALLSKVLAVRGRVLPSTLANVTLCAELMSGRIVRGESSITSAGEGIKRVFCDPPECPPVPQALQAIAEADAIILGPGSLYTSVLPNLLVQGMGDALRRSKAPKVYVCNVMTQPGETDGFSAAQHVAVFDRHCGAGLIDQVIVNTEGVPRDLLLKYQRKGQRPVTVDYKNLERMQCHVVRARLINKENLVRHDPVRLAQTVMRLVLREKGLQSGVGFIDGLLFKRKLSRSKVTPGTTTNPKVFTQE